MKRGENRELVVQGQTEAGVVAHYLTKFNMRDLTYDFEPPITAKPMGRLAFYGSRIEDAFRTSDRTEYIVHDPRYAEIIAGILVVSSVGPLDYTPEFLSRRAFLAERMRGHGPNIDSLPVQAL